MILQALDELIEFVDADDEHKRQGWRRWVTEQRSVVLKRLMNIKDKDGGDKESITLASWWVGRWSPLSRASPLAISASPWMGGLLSP